MIRNGISSLHFWPLMVCVGQREISHWSQRGCWQPPPPPTRKCFRKFLVWGTNATTWVGVVRRKRSVQTLENCKSLQVVVEAAPQTSLCRHALLLCFLLSTAHRMLKRDLGYHPYKLQIVQELKETNFARWKDFCKHYLHLQLPGGTESIF